MFYFFNRMEEDCQPKSKVVPEIRIIIQASQKARGSRRFAWHPEAAFFVDGAGRSIPPPSAEANGIFSPTFFPAEAAGANLPDPRVTAKWFALLACLEFDSQGA
jgi:hypothetical protein